MKTKSPLRTRFSVVLLLGFSGAALLSCSTSKTASNYDRDGIYGASQPSADASSNKDNNYKEYFGSLRKDDQPDQIFTNVDDYNSGYGSNSVTTESYNGSPSWGSDADHVTVNVYDNGWGYNSWNSGWGWNLGWGWNSWYGPYYGWNFDPWYGSYYGYNWGYYPYYYNNYYGGYNNYHNHYYAYGNGRRTSAPRTYENPGRVRSDYSGGRNYGARAYSSGRTYTTTRNNSVRSYSGGTRNYNSYSTPRPSYSSGTRSQAQPSTRSYDGGGTRSSSYSAPVRSYSGSSSSSSGASYGGGGSESRSGGRR